MSEFVENDKARQADSEAALQHDEAIEASTASPRQIHGLKWFLVVLATLTSTLIYALDNTIVADIVPAIVNDFNSSDQLPWLSVGFVLGGSAVSVHRHCKSGTDRLSLCYRLANSLRFFNSKHLFIGSLLLFLGASALCGGANNMAAEIVGRVLAGAGGNVDWSGDLVYLSQSPEINATGIALCCTRHDCLEN
ncbi:hypothetical protein AMS68_004494 [Peltaster fructicola]|uniref:Major facilitator superfamily (MFS) profile domain-containing protein n=1 Tax=Peltaster fructicola TaxID=286661 RepID=A0A6H0XW37_9PEZI|nr:hypothetical protein AMS68_004494 [Peltaster fructicola]